MTLFRDVRAMSPLLGFSLLLLAPAIAVRSGALSFDLRFEALLIVSALCIGACVLAGFSSSELGLSTPWIARHWVGGTALTLVLALAILLEANLVADHKPQPDWAAFVPFYVLVSSPCQEVVCRAIPKLIADRAQMSGRNYVLFSAAVFSLMHFAYGDSLLLLNTFFAGLAWAAAYLVTRNIWPLVASHAAIGTLAFWLGVA